MHLFELKSEPNMSDKARKERGTKHRTVRGVLYTCSCSKSIKLQHISCLKIPIVDQTLTAVLIGGCLRLQFRIPLKLREAGHDS